MADELQNNGLNVQGTTGHENEVVTVRGSMTSFQKFKDNLIGIPNQSDAVYYTQAEADAYNAELEGALNSTDPLTAEEAAAYNAATPGATKEAGDTLSEAEANGYNATLDGAVDTSTVKTPAVPKKVKDYVDDKTVIPVDVESLTVSSTFVKNNIVAVNGKIYIAKTATTDFPFVPIVDEDGKIAIEVINGATAICVEDDTLSDDWELWQDVSSDFKIEERTNEINERTDNVVANAASQANTNLYATTSRVRRTDFDLADLKKAVAECNLEKYGLKVGDQKTINGHTYVIAGLNTMKGAHFYTCTQNHVGLIVIPHTTQAWNASGNTYTGADGREAGYLNSDLHYYLKNTLLPLVNTDLGASNLIGHSKLFTNAVNQNGYNRFSEATGCASNWTWEADCKICALSEVQVYGSVVWSSSGYDTGEACRQLEVFQKYSHTEIFGGEYPWLRDVVSAYGAAVAADTGHAAHATASAARYVAALILFH